MRTTLIGGTPHPRLETHSCSRPPDLVTPDYLTGGPRCIPGSPVVVSNGWQSSSALVSVGVSQSPPVAALKRGVSRRATGVQHGVDDVHKRPGAAFFGPRERLTGPVPS